MTAVQQNAAIGADMVARYHKFGLQAIQPERPPDVLQDQLIPGRPRMLQHFGEIDRFRGSVAAVEGRQVRLSDGTQHEVETLLWGTGYGTDLQWIDSPRIAAIRTVNELCTRCGCIFRSLDAPDLYFPGVGLDGIGAAPWAYMLIARSIMSHIRGTAQLDWVAPGHKINHLEIARLLSLRDAGSYPAGRGWEFYRRMALDTPDEQPYPLL